MNVSPTGTVESSLLHVLWTCGYAGDPVPADNHVHSHGSE